MGELAADGEKIKKFDKLIQKSVGHLDYPCGYIAVRISNEAYPLSKDFSTLDSLDYASEHGFDVLQTDAALQFAIFC